MPRDNRTPTNRRAPFARAAFLACVGLLLSATAARAEYGDPEIRPWAEVLAFYEYNVSNYPGDDPRFEQIDENRFDLNRVWFGLDANLTQTWFARVVLAVKRADEISAETGTVPSGEADDPDTPEDESEQQVVTDLSSERTGAYEAYLTYAYFSYRPFRWFNFDFGMIRGAYVASIFRHWKHRYIEENLVFRNRLIRSGYGDLGAAIASEIPGGFGAWRVAALNGEGKLAAEQNAGKAIEAMAWIAPLAPIRAFEGFEIMGTLREDTVQPDAPEVQDSFRQLLVGYRYKHASGYGFGLGVEGVRRRVRFDAGRDITTHAAMAFADIFFPGGFGLVGRYDYLDPDIENDKDTGQGYNDERDMIVAAVYAQPIKFVRLAIGGRQEGTAARYVDSSGDSKESEPDRYLFFATELKF
ncbi:hypothetical protein K8I61_18435 [bacterium]|nr:hypothetical protein [bacterium]